MGNYEEALSDFNHAIELSPDNAGCYMNRADLYEKIGQTEQAKTDYKRAVGLDSKYIKAVPRKYQY